MTVASCDQKTNDRSARPQDEDGSEAGTSVYVSCFDTIEARAIACAAPAVARVSPASIRIRFDDGRDTTIVDDTAGEAPGGFHYLGRIGRPSYHVLEWYGHEAFSTFVLLNARTGRATLGVDSIALSPDSSRIATVAEGWDDCSESDGSRITIWRLTDSVPVKEYDDRPWECRTSAGHAATDVRWKGPDTVLYTRVDFPAPEPPQASAPRSTWTTRVVTMIRSADGWRTAQP